MLPLNCTLSRDGRGEAVVGVAMMLLGANSGEVVARVKALAAVLCDLYSEATPAEVVAVEPDIWQQCQFTKMLTPTRLNGLANVRRLIREKAVALM